MVWSYSSHRQFKRCQRQWFYKNVMANANAKKDPLRREAYILSNLLSIYAWRGNIVDNIISRIIIPQINSNRDISIEYVLDKAKSLCRRQFDFAMEQKYREDGFTKSGAGNNFAAFRAIEYDNEITSSEFRKAWEEIELSLTNFLSNTELVAYLKSANHLITQRPLMFQLNGYTIRAVPDLIAFFDNGSPHIFDWKVHYFGNKSFHDQLLIYALALNKCDPHQDFPSKIDTIPIVTFKLSEYQLLNDRLREYSIESDQIDRLVDNISESILEMVMAGADKKYPESNLEDFETTLFPETCQYCSFKKICWEE